MVRLVAASLLDERNFMRQAPLALSTAKIAQRGGATLQARFRNTLPLAATFNPVIASSGAEDIVAFAHDDLYIEDWFLPERLEEALARFDVVGVAGNLRRLPGQRAWPFTAEVGTWDVGNLSGSVGHVANLRDYVSAYGPVPAEVKLLDGVFLAARAGTLREAGVEFDPRFPFHFYDLDFCRSCEKAGLRMGTWPIAVTHDSKGAYNTPEWEKGYEAYLAKWGE